MSEAMPVNVPGQPIGASSARRPVESEAATRPSAVTGDKAHRPGRGFQGTEGMRTMLGDKQLRSHVGSRRGPRLSAAARCEQLIRVALDEFSGRGFAGTTTREIASKAGVTEAVIFQHFATKEALYSAIIDYKAAESGSSHWIEEMRRCGREDDDAGAIRTIVRRILEQGAHDPQFLRLMLHSALEGHGLFRHFRAKQIQPVYEFLRTYVERRQAEGQFRRGDPHTLVRALIAVPSHYALQEDLFQMSARGSSTDVVGELTEFALAGLRDAPDRAKRRVGGAARRHVRTPKR